MRLTLIGPLLLGIPSNSLIGESDSDWTALPRHRDEPQVELDVNRSFVYYPSKIETILLIEHC